MYEYIIKSLPFSQGQRLKRANLFPFVVSKGIFFLLTIKSEVTHIYIVFSRIGFCIYDMGEFFIARTV